MSVTSPEHLEIGALGASWPSCAKDKEAQKCNVSWIPIPNTLDSRDANVVPEKSLMWQFSHFYNPGEPQVERSLTRECATTWPRFLRLVHSDSAIPIRTLTS